MDFDATASARKREKQLRHGMSIKNFWGTPLDVFAALDREFDFDVDAAAEAATSKCPLWFGLDHPDPNRRDALLASVRWGGDSVFLNPPYSPDGGTILRWVQRAHLEVTHSRASTVVLLLPATPDTEWAEFCARYADEIRFTPRIPFDDPAGKRTAPMGGSMVVVLRRNPKYNTEPGHGTTPRVVFGYAPWKEE